MAEQDELYQKIARDLAAYIGVQPEEISINGDNFFYKNFLVAFYEGGSLYLHNRHPVFVQRPGGSEYTRINLLQLLLLVEARR